MQKNPAALTQMDTSSLKSVMTSLTYMCELQVKLNAIDVAS
jgi:hypothetical protein